MKESKVLTLVLAFALAACDGNSGGNDAGCDGGCDGNPPPATGGPCAEISITPAEGFVKDEASARLRSLRKINAPSLDRDVSCS